MIISLDKGKYRLTKELPNTLSDLLQVALDDLIIVEKLSNINIDMGTWCTNYDDKCAVCMAGAVMYNNSSLDFSKNKHIYPHDFKKEIHSRLLAIDCLRSGEVFGAWGYIYYNGNDIKLNDPKYEDICKAQNEINALKPAGRYYNINPHEYKIRIQKIIQILKKHNL